MKLFRKIYWRVFLAIWILAVSIPAFMLWEMRRQELQDAARYEENRIQNELALLSERISGYGIAANDEVVRNSIISYEFRSIFKERGILACKGEEILNMSVYEFDWEKLREQAEAAEPYPTFQTLYVSGPQNAAGKKLLLFYQKQAVFDSRCSLIVYLDVTEIDRRAWTLFGKGLFFSLLLLAVSGVLLYRGICRIMEPLDKLNRAAAAIAEGDYGSRVPADQGFRADEISEVTGNFNKMADKVEEHLEELAEVNERQRQLLGSLAHELKTPITAIIGYADMLLTVRLQEEKRTDALLFILNEGRRLSGLSEKMLRLAGLYGESKDALELRETDVARLFDRLKNGTDALLGEKRIALETAASPEGLKITLDEDLMLSLLTNLVDNACKASEAGGRIIVSADENGFAVEDFGCGIPEQEIARVTEAFYMVDKSRSRKAGGAGLGLALCEQIARIHGGRLVIESAPGKGTKVSVVF